MNHNMKSSRSEITELPKWWLNVASGINSAIAAGKKSYTEPGIVLGEELDDDDKLVGYIVRDRSRTAKLLPLDKLSGNTLVVGTKLKGKLPLTTDVAEPSLVQYIRTTIHRQARCLPITWLNKTISNRINGLPMTTDEYGVFQRFDKTGMTNEEITLRTFAAWVVVPYDRKNDLKLKEMLLKVVEVGGLRYLSKFNFLLEEGK